jgi:hypothetical protein
MEKPITKLNPILKEYITQFKNYELNVVQNKKYGIKFKTKGFKKSKVHEYKKI